MHALAIPKLLPCVKNAESPKWLKKCLQAKDSCGIELEQCLVNEAVEKVSVKEMFWKWQWTYEMKHQSMAWLRAEMDDLHFGLVCCLLVVRD